MSQGDVVRRAPDLGKLAQQEGLIYVAVPRELAQTFHDWSSSIQVRFGNDSRHTVLRTLSIRPVAAESPPQRKQHQPPRDGRRPTRPPEKPSDARRSVRPPAR